MSHGRCLRMILSSACAATIAAPGAGAPQANVFSSPSTLPFQAPRFNAMRDGDFIPAFNEGMARQDSEIARISNNPAPPTFDNTLVPLERSGQMLDRVQAAFNVFSETDTNLARQAARKAIAPRLAAHSDAIYLNSKLFRRVRAIHDRSVELNLDPEQRQLVDTVYQRFVRSGTNLSPTDKLKLRSINAQLSTLQATFEQEVLAGTADGALIVDDPKLLAGLGGSDLAAASEAAKARGLAGKWVISLQNTTQQPALAALLDRQTREHLFQLSWTRTERGDVNDSRRTIARIAKLRAEKAALLGYPNWASYALANQMAGTPANAEAFLAKLIPATVAEQHREAAEIDQLIKSGGGNFTVKPWDWQLYSEQVRKARFDLDEEEVKPYFELNNVLEKGLFFAANQLYGISFKERHDLPVWNNDVRVFEVSEAKGKHLGLFYCDYFKRDNKQGGAWTNDFVPQSKLLGTTPVVYNVANISKPAAGQPALVSADDVNTMFHEFGHALHALFQNVTYPSLGETARDWVEFPSQFNEHWALDSKVLANYALNYKTGEPMPTALVEKIRKAASFNQGYGLGELIAAAELDMRWHELSASDPQQDPDQFETAALSGTGLDLADVPTRYRSTYFQHIWSIGYAAGYYGYLWTEMLDDDAFAWMEANGGMTRANGQRYRDLILSRGHSQDYDAMFKAFYGKDPDIGPMLENHGLPATGAQH